MKIHKTALCAVVGSVAVLMHIPHNQPSAPFMWGYLTAITSVVFTVAVAWLVVKD